VLAHRRGYLVVNNELTREMCVLVRTNPTLDDIAAVIAGFYEAIRRLARFILSLPIAISRRGRARVAS